MPSLAGIRHQTTTAIRTNCLHPGHRDRYRPASTCCTLVNVADHVLTSGDPRAEAAAALLHQLEDLVVTYAAIPEHKRQAQLAKDADRITGEVAQLLHAARRKITPTVQF